MNSNQQMLLIKKAQLSQRQFVLVRTALGKMQRFSGCKLVVFGDSESAALICRGYAKQLEKAEQALREVCSTAESSNSIPPKLVPVHDDSVILQKLSAEQLLKKRCPRGGQKRSYRNHQKYIDLVNRNCNGVEFNWPLSGGPDGEKRMLIHWMETFKYKKQNTLRERNKVEGKKVFETNDYRTLARYLRSLKKKGNKKLDLVGLPLEDCLFETFYRLDKYLFNGYFWALYEKTGKLFDIVYRADLYASENAVGCTMPKTKNGDQIRIRIQGERYKDEKFKKLLLSTIGHEMIHAFLINCNQEDPGGLHGSRFKKTADLINRLLGVCPNDRTSQRDSPPVVDHPPAI